MKKILYLLFLVPFLPSCFLTNTENLNVCGTLSNMRVKQDVSTNEVISIKKVYRLKNGLVVDQYNHHYGFWYMVRRGDTLYGISRTYGINVPLLASVNQFGRGSLLKYKAFLFIPLSETYLERNAEAIEIQLKKGEFIWPVFGPVRSGFGLRQWGWRKKFHKGIDISSSVGTKVMASAEGTIRIASYQSDYGYLIVIEHDNDFQSYYAHLEKILVKKGDWVDQGQVIGLVGKTGHATGYHLHFEIRINDYAVNPVDYLPEETGEYSRIFNEEAGRSLR